MPEKKRPAIRIRFKFNKDTGEIEEFIIDDNAPGASEEYHDKIAQLIAGRLGHEPAIEDAGPVRLPQIEPAAPPQVPASEEDEEETPQQEAE